MLTTRLGVLIVAFLLAIAFGTGSASAAAPAPGWTMDSLATPTNFSADDNTQCLDGLSASLPLCDTYQVTVTNAGAVASLETPPATIVDRLPAGLTVQRVAFLVQGIEAGEFFCKTVSGEHVVVQCEDPLAVGPDETLTMRVFVTVDDPSASGPLTNTATVSGGGAQEESTKVDDTLSNTSPPFGPANFNFYIDGVDGGRDSQAGDHPYELTTTIDLNNKFRVPPDRSGTGDTSVNDVKDVVVNLPLGFAGSTLAAPECTFAQLSAHIAAGVGGCPPNTVVGHIFTEPESSDSVNGQIYNMVPEHGRAGEFAFVDALAGAHVFYVHVVPTPAGYVLQAMNPDTPQISLTHIVVTFYGDPATRDGTGNASIPFFTNPTSCASGPLKATIYMDSWQHPGGFLPDGSPDLEGDPSWVSKVSEAPPVTGCNALQFAPELKAQPTTTVADSPTGLDFELKLPQSEEVGVRATPALKTATVTLPDGVTVDPSAANGLAACSVAQIGWLGGSPFNFSAARPECPDATKIGSLELTTPLIPGTLTGAVYLASQNENPFGSVLAAYVVVDDPITGVLLKIAGEFKSDPRTGRLTAVFAENPQLPFSDLKLHFFGGPRAELATPESCGTFTTTSDLAPWSAPDSGPDGSPFDTFPISSGCVNGFSPTFAAGSTNLQAGAYAPFVASFTRSDTDQDLAGLSVTLPPGLLARITGVPLCPDANASAGTCPEASQVGTVQVGAGPGPSPLFVNGKAYLTGPYKGGPYGLAVVVPAIAGPFNFGTVVVRQSLHIDSSDAHATDISDPFPTILNPTGTNGQTVGIPIKLRRVDVRIDRPGFTFNPTNCGKLQVSGSLSSTGGANPTLATPFQVTNCATLKFAPKFAVSTSGKTSKANGASLTAKLSYPNAQQGTYANITKVKVDLPKQLPSRLTTLQKACTNAQFQSDPAGCPAPSIIGHATVTTPLLPLPLTGPAYFVSHGGEAFPSLTMILRGNGVTVDLVGTTFINKAGITSTTFRTVPDVPFNTFELTLPPGKFSALAANGDLCKSKLAMPTEFLAQNGAVIHQSTPVSVTSCARSKSLTRKQKLAKAMRACRRKPRSKRLPCARGARRKYGPVKGRKR